MVRARAGVGHVPSCAQRESWEPAGSARKQWQVDTSWDSARSGLRRRLREVRGAPSASTRKEVVSFLVAGLRESSGALTPPRRYVVSSLTAVSHPGPSTCC